MSARCEASHILVAGIALNCGSTDICNTHMEKLSQLKNSRKPGAKINSIVYLAKFLLSELPLGGGAALL